MQASPHDDPTATWPQAIGIKTRAIRFQSSVRILDRTCSEAGKLAWKPGKLCAQCSLIDLDLLFSSGNSSQAQEFLHQSLDRAYVLKGMDISTCSLCRIFASVIFDEWMSTPVATLADTQFSLNLGSVVLPFATMLSSAVNPRSSLFNAQPLCVVRSFQVVPPKVCQRSILPVLKSPSAFRPGISGRLLHQRSIDFSILRGWIAHCQHRHSGTCGPLGSKYLNSPPSLAVIDCKTQRIIVAPLNCRYVALSYVWGTPRKEEERNVTMGGFLPVHTPNTITDAIQVVLRIGLQYLWVDKYCIDQVEPLKKRQQIAAMDSIYNQASVTIIAAAGQDHWFGLPGVGETPRVSQPTVEIDGQIWVSSLREPDQLIKKSKWSTRAWTYQEGILARRRLIFTEEQVSFECNSMACQESVEYDLLDLYDKPTESWSSMFHGGVSSANMGLDDYIKSYSRRLLTMPYDKLNGILGILNVFAKMPTPTRHYWGVPIDFWINEDTIGKFKLHSPWPICMDPIHSVEPPTIFPGYLDAAFGTGLCWTLAKATSRRHGFPSWSWAGRFGEMSDWAWGADWIDIETAVLNKQSDPELKISLQRHDGGFDRLNEAAMFKSGRDNPSVDIYSQVLKVEAWNVELKFTCITEVPGQDHISYEPKSRFYTVFQVPNGPNGGVLYCPLRLTQDLHPNDPFHAALQRETYHAIILQTISTSAIVVRKVDDYYERFGFISLDLCFWKVKNVPLSDGPGVSRGDVQWEDCAYKNGVLRTSGGLPVSLTRSRREILVG